MTAHNAHQALNTWAFALLHLYQDTSVASDWRQGHARRCSTEDIRVTQVPK